MINDQQLGQVLAHLRAALRSMETADHMAQGQPVSTTIAHDAIVYKIREIEELRKRASVP
jgi:hypothetical protein